jgi:hypothetical protein
VLRSKTEEGNSQKSNLQLPGVPRGESLRMRGEREGKTFLHKNLK